MCLAAFYSGKAISISKTTAPHALSYPFTSYFNIPHGHAVSLTLNEEGLDESKVEIRDNLFIHKAQDPYPYEDKEFDLVISLGCLHNLRIFELQKALKEIERVGKKGYVMLESYRNELEQFNLQCWALTCESFFDKEEWIWIYDHFGYTGDYEFIYFE